MAAYFMIISAAAFVPAYMPPFLIAAVVGGRRVIDEEQTMMEPFPPAVYSPSPGSSHRHEGGTSRSGWESGSCTCIACVP